MREKLASLFKREIKNEVVGQSSYRKLRDEAPRGVFGGKQRFYINLLLQTEILIISGDQKMFNVLSSATRKSSVLSKAVIERKYPRAERDDGPGPSHGYDRRDRDYHRYRDRSRSPAKKRYNSGSHSKWNSKKSKKSGGKDGGKSARESKAKK